MSNNEGFPTFNEEDVLLKSSKKRGFNKQALLIRDKKNSNDKLNDVNKSLVL